MTPTQGTYEFMSRRLVNNLEYPEPYLHSPVDDLESFYYTAQWATAFNDGVSGKRHDKIRRFREMIAGGGRTRATSMVECDLHPAWAEAEYGPFFARSLSLLCPWHAKVMQQSRDWMDVKYQADELYGEDKERYLCLNFLIHGYRGVGEYLELVHKHRASLQGAV